MHFLNLFFFFAFRLSRIMNSRHLATGLDPFFNPDLQTSHVSSRTVILSGVSKLIWPSLLPVITKLIFYIMSALAMTSTNFLS